MAEMKETSSSVGVKKQEPTFELSGKLAAETNRYAGVNLLYSQPPEARNPKEKWRLYIFKSGELLDVEPIPVHRSSVYLFGKDRRVADVPTDHPSSSKQHAVLQYRLVEQEKSDGTLCNQVKPYLMDLGTRNGTSINGDKMEERRYYELFEKDVIKFGNSTRDYVLLHENSV